jgi:hypothetical protein
MVMKNKKIGILKLNKMTKQTWAYIVIIVGFMLLIWNISELDFDNLKKGPFSGIVSNILLIAAMIVSIRNLKKKENI